jgi:hypothetical protein
LFTLVVVTVKFAIVLPADTVTVDDTVALLGLLLDSVTISPPLGAGDVSVTVPVELFPPRTAVGLSDNADNAAGGWGLTVKVVDFVTPL